MYSTAATSAAASSAGARRAPALARDRRCVLSDKAARWRPVSGRASRSEFRSGRSLVLAAAADEPTVSLTDAEREEMARLEASGDAFERLVELAKQGGVDIPPSPKSPAASMCGPMTVTDDTPPTESIPGLPAGLTKPPGCVGARPAASDTRRSRRMSADSRSPPCARRPCAPTSASAGTATPAPPPS